MEFFVADFVYLSPPNEDDGERRELIGYQVAYQLARGNRFYHDHTFTDKKLAEIFVAKIRIAIKGGRKLDEKHWNEGDPMYGSQAYQDGGSRWADEERARDDDDSGFQFHSHGGWR